MPKVVYPEKPRFRSDAVPIDDAKFAESVGKALAKTGANTVDYYRLARAMVAFFEKYPEEQEKFVKWYESL